MFHCCMYFIVRKVFLVLVKKKLFIIRLLLQHLCAENFQKKHPIILALKLSKSSEQKCPKTFKDGKFCILVYLMAEPRPVRDCVPLSRTQEEMFQRRTVHRKPIKPALGIAFVCDRCKCYDEYRILEFR